MNVLINVPFNAICQAVKRLVPGISRNAHRSVCGYPNCVTATNRYWWETYNIKPWEKRSDEERAEAVERAKLLVIEAVDNGILPRRTIRRRAIVK